jgi:acyl-coenzyme A thioesterase PaaI-like protein
MDKKVIEAIKQRVANEPYARKLGLRLLRLEPGYALVEMGFRSDMVRRLTKKGDRGERSLFNNCIS